ncbi:MAG: hypothetical protein JO029_13735 [Candidatus Eremiobacteraeota bacterium]|nr:hypothetical protein [Candidatus Eremiobacteraeota bacterium]
MMKIWEYDLRLYRLLKRCLTGDYVSPLRDQLTPAMRAGMLASLRTTELGDRCGCGGSFCHTFATRATPAGGDELFTVRFHVSGELHVTCDGSGTIYRIQWRHFEDDVAGLHCYVLTPAGWSERTLADA